MLGHGPKDRAVQMWYTSGGTKLSNGGIIVERLMEVVEILVGVAAALLEADPAVTPTSADVLFGRSGAIEILKLELVAETLGPRIGNKLAHLLRFVLKGCVVGCSFPWIIVVLFEGFCPKPGAAQAGYSKTITVTNVATYIQLFAEG